MAIAELKETDVRYIVIHCSDSPAGRGDTARDIHRWHIQRKDFSLIGYHRVILESGEVQAGRPLYVRGAHVAGMNAKSVGVCLIGRNDFTPEQMQVLPLVLKVLRARFPLAEIVGHRQLDPGKTCPNFDVPSWLARNGIKATPHD